MKRNNIAIIILSVVVFAVLAGCFYYLKTHSRQLDISPHSGITGTDFPFTVTDSLGDTVTITKEPKRIVALAPGATEILFAVGSGDKVIGVSEFSIYPPEVKDLPKIGGYTDPSIEKITALKPDLVIAQRGNSRENIQKLRELNINVIAVDPISFETLNNAIYIIGKVTGGRQADDLIKTINKLVYDIRKKGEELEFNPKVLFLFSHDGALYSAGPDSHIDEIITIAGGVNIAGDAASTWPQLSMEVVSAKNPDVILITGSHGSDSGTPIEKVIANFRADKKWQNIAAVKNGNVFYVNGDEISVLGPRLVNGLDEIYNIFKKIQK